MPTPPGSRAGWPAGGVGADWAYATGWMAVRAMPEFAARNAFDAAARYAARAAPTSCARTWPGCCGCRPPTSPTR